METTVHCLISNALLRARLSRAFRAFLKYRDLGPLRSIDAVAAMDTAAAGADTTNKSKRSAFGCIRQMVLQTFLVERAAAFDLSSRRRKDASAADSQPSTRSGAARNSNSRTRNFKKTYLQNGCDPSSNSTTRLSPTSPRKKPKAVGRTITARGRDQGMNGAGYAAILRRGTKRPGRPSSGVTAPVDDEANDARKTSMPSSGNGGSPSDSDRRHGFARSLPQVIDGAS